MSISRTLYLGMPWPIKAGLFVGKAALNEWIRYGPGYEEIARAVASRGRLTDDAMAAYRDSRVQAFVATAFRGSRYYADLLRSIGAEAEDFKSVSDLGRLPILTKKMVMEHASRIQSELIPRWQHVRVSTSGTTGQPLFFFSTRAAVKERWAIWWRYRARFGLRRGTPSLHLGGQNILAGRSRGPFWLHNPFTKQIYHSPVHTMDRHFEALLTRMGSRRPPWIHGYPTLIDALVSFLERRPSHIWDIRWVTTGAEGVRESQKRYWESVLGVRPLQHYGLAEAVANLSECPNGLLHVDEDYAAVEFIPAAQTGTFRLLGTNLSNPLFPLIRYDTGDIVRQASPTWACACGLPGRAVDTIEGRSSDFVTVGAVRVGPCNQIAKHLPHVLGVQFALTTSEELLVLVVPRPMSGVTVDDIQDAVGGGLTAWITGPVPTRIVVQDRPMRVGNGKAPTVIRRRVPSPGEGTPVLLTPMK